ncbi:MAG: DUF2156 domain-containing protein [Eubacteriales bacterium]
MTILFKQLRLESQKELNPILKIYATESCEYNFNTLYLWNSLYKTNYYINDKYIIFLNKYRDKYYTMMPICSKENYKEVFKTIWDYFNKELNIKLEMYGVEKDFANYINNNFNKEFVVIKERDNFDYIYNAEDLRQLEGKKYHKKRNHINRFIRDYGDKYIYKNITKDNIIEVKNFIKEWQDSNEGNIGERLQHEAIGIENMIINFEELDLKSGGIWIDNKLEAFTIGSYANNLDQVIIHIEKANKNIRGLYAIINQLFLNNEYPKVKTVNREDDLGITGIRKAKRSYHPMRFVEKYKIIEK